MATKLLQLYRNSSVVTNLEAAKAAMQENIQGKDGEVLICRYYDSNSQPKALVGIYNAMEDQEPTLTYLEGVNISEESTVSEEVQAAIDAAVESEKERATTAEGELEQAIKDAITTVENEITSAISALEYEDSAVAGEFVTSVSESNGVISVTRAAITSNDKTITIDGYDLAVNIDGTTITADEDGVLSVASSALVQYVGENAIAVSEASADNEKTISLTIDENDKVLSQSTSGLKTTLSVDYTSDDHMVNLKGIDGAVISSFDASEFIYDGMIQDVELVHENPETGATGEFIEIVWNLEGGETKTIYLDVTELVDVYTAGNGIDITDNEISVKIADSDEGYLQSTEAGIKTEGIKDAIDEAVASETSRAETKEAELEEAISTEETRAQEAEKELEEAIEAAQAAAATEVTLADGTEHLTLSSSTGENEQTIYTIGENDIASEATQTNIIAAAGLGEDGTLTDEQKEAIGADNLADAVANLLAEVKADEVSLSIVSGDKSITITTNSEGATDISVTLSAVEDSEYATDMIVKDTDGGLALKSTWDCGEY